MVPQCNAEAFVNARAASELNGIDPDHTRNTFVNARKLFLRDSEEVTGNDRNRLVTFTEERGNIYDQLRQSQFKSSP